jgi:hypothetical protein
MRRVRKGEALSRASTCLPSSSVIAAKNEVIEFKILGLFVAVLYISFQSGQRLRRGSSEAGEHRPRACEGAPLDAVA